MRDSISLNKIYIQSEENVVTRQIAGEFLLIPIIAGVGDLEDAIFTLNETGKIIWEKLNGEKTLREIVKELSFEYNASPKKITKEVVGFLKELLKKKMIEEVHQPQ